MMILLTCYIALAVLVGMWASDKGRAGILGFFGALFLTPLVVAICPASATVRQVEDFH